MNRIDAKNLLGKLTFRKIWNGAKILFSYYYSKLTGQPMHLGLPISVSIEPTTACNLRCPECPSGLRSFTRSTGMIDEEFFRKCIDELHRELVYLTFYFQGEPYLHPRFLDMVQYASGKKIYTSTSTNAHFLNDEKARLTIGSGLDRLIISIDGTTQEVYEQYRSGGRLNKVLEGARSVVEWKQKLKSPTPFIIFQFLVVKPNEHQIEDVHKLAREMGVDAVWFKTAQVYDYIDGNELIPSIEKYSRYKKLRDGTYRIKNNLLNHCWKMWQSCVITWDGKVVPCCFDKDAHHVLGNLGEQSMKEIWRSDAYVRFRKSVFRSRSSIDICTNCSEGLTVWQ